LAVRVAAAKGLDDQDAIMLKALTLRVARALSNAMKRGIVRDAGKRKDARIWQL
jgi:cobalamin-dependent methionine synthase I